jgi:N-acyl-D-aspartate/D-glutamate deacylase
MAYDLLIRDGIVVDGSGMPRVRADVAVEAGRIVRIGRIREAAKRVIDAEGQVVAPGFVDGHTHMDAQICWDPLGTCSSYHGVTSVLMGNCGFTLAPSRSEARDLAVRNLERSEDIAAEAMAEGIDWQWESFPEYLEALERLPKGIHYGGYVGHSALRTFVMGERAFEERAGDEDLEGMRRELRAGLEAGAFGFTTSRSIQHLTPDDQPVASRLADWEEVRSLVEVVGELPGGLFEIANEDAPLTDLEARAEYFARLEQLALDTGVPISFGVGSMSAQPEGFREWLQMIDRASLRGGRMFAQVHARAFTIMLSFPGQLPFARLVRMAHEGTYGNAVAAEARKPDFDRIFVMDSPMGPHRCVGQLAREREIDPVELMIEMALASDLEQHFLQPLANENADYVLELMRHPRSVVTFSDAGAHVSQISDCSIPTYVLGHWVRDEQALTLEEGVRMLSFENASAFGLRGRGLLREGFAADLVVFDPDRIAPQMPQIAHDLPGGARRLVQHAEGISATVVAGEVLLENGKHTGALPGRLLRRGSDAF